MATAGNMDQRPRPDGGRVDDRVGHVGSPYGGKPGSAPDTPDRPHRRSAGFGCGSAGSYRCNRRLHRRSGACACGTASAACSGSGTRPRARTCPAAPPAPGPGPGPAPTPAHNNWGRFAPFAAGAAAMLLIAALLLWHPWTALGAGGGGNTGAGGGGNAAGGGQTGIGAAWSPAQKCAWLQSNFPQDTAGVQKLGARLAGVQPERVRTHLYPCSGTQTAFDGFVVLGPNEGYSGSFTLQVPTNGAVDSYPGAAFTGSNRQIGVETVRAFDGSVTAVTASYWPWLDENPPAGGGQALVPQEAPAQAPAQVAQTKAAAPAVPKAASGNCMLASVLAAQRGWKVIDNPTSVTKYGGSVVELPPGASLPSGWEFSGSPGAKPANGGVFSIYPPNDGVCRARLGVAS